jgi:hypothetical protein
MDDAAKVDKALGLIECYGQVDGDHHKAWVIDQIARVLLGDDYDTWVKAQEAGEDGPETYPYETGIAP